MGERKRSYFADNDSNPLLPESSSGRPPEGGSSVGALLRRQRERTGYAVGDVAAALRIRPAYLAAIEEGRFGDLPGPAYVAGFLRAYAEHLELDPHEVVRRYKEEASGELAKAELYLPQPVPEGRIPGGAMLLVGVVLAAGIYGGWFYMTSTGRNLVDLVPPLPERLASALHVETILSPTSPPVVVSVPAGSVAAVPETETPAPAHPAEPATVSAATPAPAPVPEALPNDAPASTATAPADPAQTVAVLPPETADDEEQPVVEATPLAELRERAAETPAAAAEPRISGPQMAAAAVPAIPPAPPLQPAALPVQPAALPAPPAAAQASVPEGRVYGVTNGPSRIQLRAVQESWVQVRDGSGDLLMTRVLRPGDVYRAPDQPGLRLVTGNAGGLLVMVDGVAGPAIGAPGQVMRDVPLDPQRLMAGAQRTN